MSWEDDVESLTVRRNSEGAITTITVAGIRKEWRHNGCSRIAYDLVYHVDDDGGATLWKVQTDGNTVIAGHLMALLPMAERAVSAIPDVQAVEPLEESIERRRPTEVNQ